MSGPSIGLGAITRWSLHRPRLVAWACVWVLACGLFFLRDMQFDLLPDLAPAETTIETDAPGFVAEQVEQTVTRPIESALAAAPGIERVRSQSIQGLSIVRVRFSPGADPARVRQAVVENLGRVGGLPPGVSPPRIAPLSAAGDGVLKIGFTSDKLDPMALRDLVQWTVRPRLLSTPGVGRVTLYGGQVRRIEVRARPGDLSDSDLGFLDILNATRRATSFAGAGFIDTPNQRVLIEPHGQAQAIEAVGAGQIQTPGSDPVRIDDVADVVEAPAPAFGDALIDGKPGLLLAVDHDLGANTRQTTKAVDQALAVLRPSLAAQGVQVAADLDRPASFVSEAIRGIVMDLLIGMILATLILLFLLRDLRAVLVSIISIPLTFLASVVVLKFLGWTLNSMTLGGLAVAFGMVMDDAVIDVENIVATLREAEARHASRLEAILAASLEIRRPVAYATLPVAASLAPLLTLHGVQGALLAPLACAIIVALLVSLVVAMTVTPALAWLFLQHIGPAAEHRHLQMAKAWHAAWLGRIGARPALVMIVATAAVVLALGAVWLFPSELLPSVDDDHLMITASAPAATPPQVVRDLGVRIAADLKSVAGVRSIAESIGRDPTADDTAAVEQSRFDIALTPGLTGVRQQAIARQIQKRLSLYPGLQPRIRSRFDAGQAADEDAVPFQVGVFGPDLDALETAAGRIAQVLGSVHGGGAILTPDIARAPVVRVDLNFPRLALYGLSAADVSDTIQAAFAGETVAQIYDGARVVDLAISAQQQVRRDPEMVGALLLRSTSGISVPLKSVANVYLTDGPATITHENGLRTQRIDAYPASGDIIHFAKAAREAVTKQVALPPGAFIEYSQANSAAAAHADLAIRYALAIFAVFALLAVAFDGRTAVLIMASSLFALVGGVGAVAFLGGVLSIGAVVGFIALLGLSMRGAILLISRAEDLVLHRHAPWSMATLISAARERSGPMVMTALLVAAAVAPLAVQGGHAGREILGPMAVVILGGLLTGTLANLLILPTLMFAFWRPGYGRRARHPIQAP